MTAIPKPKKPPKLMLRYDIPVGTKPAKCRSCRATVYWVKTGLTSIPLDLDEEEREATGNIYGTSHFLTCPQASQWSKGTKPATASSADRKTCEHDVDHCPRCGGEHGTMTFYELERSADSFGWWALCPKTSEPLLLRTKAQREKGGAE